MALHRDPGRRFDQALRYIASVAELPPEIVTLRTRLSEFTGRAGTPIADRLAAAVVDGDTSADVDLLWSAGLAETASSPALRNELLTAVHDRVRAAIRNRYADHAVRIYETVAATFNAAADAFTAAAATVDPELPAEEIVDLPDKERKAWRAAADRADKMRRLVEPLHAAAVLAGICGSDADAALPLTVDADGLECAQVWAAWQIEDRQAKAQRAAAAHQPFTTDITATRSRCGRWSALLALGARIRACPADGFTDCPRKRVLDPVDALTAH